MSEKLVKFTDELRYLPYKDWTKEYHDKLKKVVNSSPWRNSYHIEPETGLLNDPNGFSYFNHKWQLFYQFYPYGPVHGLKSWYHLESKDLVHWEPKGVALLPDLPYDSHGVYSGSATPIGDQLFIYYTGNTRDKDWIRTPYQMGAWMNKDYSFEKIKEPLIMPREEATDHFRDPQIFKYASQYYMILGAQTKNDLEGVIYLYRAKSNQINDWELVGQLDFTNETQGYMIECPNIVFIDNHPVLIYCPQGIDKKVLRYDNIFPNAYIVGDVFDPNCHKIINASSIQNLDEGFDVYATQAFNAPDGRALAISWLGLPDLTYPSDEYGHQGALSLVKELSLKNGKLYQYPVKETKDLRKSKVEFQNSYSFQTNQYELKITVKANTNEIFYLYADKNKERYLKIVVDAKEGRVEIDRAKVGIPTATKYGTKRYCYVDSQKDITLSIFVDTSIFECYINYGEKVITGRVFPYLDQNYLFANKGTIWPLTM